MGAGVELEAVPEGKYGGEGKAGGPRGVRDEGKAGAEGKQGAPRGRDEGKGGDEGGREEKRRVLEVGGGDASWDGGGGGGAGSSGRPSVADIEHLSPKSAMSPSSSIEPMSSSVGASSPGTGRSEAGGGEGGEEGMEEGEGKDASSTSAGGGASWMGTEMSELQNSLWRGRVSKDIMLAYAQMGTPKATYVEKSCHYTIFSVAKYVH